MTPLDIFLNRHDRLRGGWRFLLFCSAFFAVYWGVGGAVGDPFRLTFLFAATLVGWACGRFFEGLPFRALGWTPHRGWLRDSLLGALFGVGAIVLTVLLCVLFGGYRFEFTPPAPTAATLGLALRAAAAWVVPAAAEEALFRGYPLQTTMRAWPFWVAATFLSVLFACIHLLNPNFHPFAFVNTALAGLWLAAAYRRTRSLWLPLALHWAWNWAMGSLFGLPVSGVTRYAEAAVFRPAETARDWLTGGAYGPEGGAACTLVLVLSTIFVCRTRLLAADPELELFTDGEQKQPGVAGSGVGSQHPKFKV